MHPQKAHKIELDIIYPCPCRRRGQLISITLTEAFGCDRCQQIFVVDKEGYIIEQLAMTSPYKRSWRWTGHQWHVVQPGLNNGYLPLALMVVMVLLLVWLPAARYIPQGPYTILWAFAALMLVVLPTVMVWLTQRR